MGQIDRSVGLASRAAAWLSPIPGHVRLTYRGVHVPQHLPGRPAAACSRIVHSRPDVSIHRALAAAHQGLHMFQGISMPAGCMQPVTRAKHECCTRLSSSALQSPAMPARSICSLPGARMLQHAEHPKCSFPRALALQLSLLQCLQDSACWAPSTEGDRHDSQ